MIESAVYEVAKAQNKAINAALKAIIPRMTQTLPDLVEIQIKKHFSV